MLAGLGHAFEAFAVARKNLHTQLFFQFNDGLGHPRLRGVQDAGSLGQVEIAANGFLYKAKLVKIHIK